MLHSLVLKFGCFNWKYKNRQLDKIKVKYLKKVNDTDNITLYTQNKYEEKLKKNTTKLRLWLWVHFPLEVIFISLL